MDKATMTFIVEPYRGTTCDNQHCSNFKKEIKPDLDWATLSLPAELIGQHFRSFCKCGDGAGWVIKNVILKN